MKIRRYYITIWSGVFAFIFFLLALLSGLLGWGYYLHRRIAIIAGVFALVHISVSLYGLLLRKMKR